MSSIWRFRNTTPRPVDGSPSTPPGSSGRVHLSRRAGPTSACTSLYIATNAVIVLLDDLVLVLSWTRLPAGSGATCSAPQGSLGVPSFRLHGFVYAGLEQANRMRTDRDMLLFSGLYHFPLLNLVCA